MAVTFVRVIWEFRSATSQSVAVSCATDRVGRSCAADRIIGDRFAEETAVVGGAQGLEGSS